MRIFLGLLAACSVALALVACADDQRSGTGGSSSGDHEVAREEPLPRGCQPAEVASLLSGFASAVAERRQGEALRYIATGPGFVTMTIYHGQVAGANRVDSSTAGAAYRNLVAAFGEVEDPQVLSTVVGPVAPLEGDRRGPQGSNPTAGAEFVIGLGGRSLSGKIGVDCATGQIFVGAMNVRKGLIPQKACGSYVRLKAKRPLICSYAT